MTKVVAGIDSGWARIELEDLFVADFLIENPSFLSMVLAGKIDESLLHITDVFHSLLQDCVAGAASTEEVVALLKMVEGLLNEATVRIRHSTLVLPTVTLPEDVINGIPAEVYNTPIKRLFGGKKPWHNLAHQLSNREGTRSYPLDTIPLGRLLELSEEEFLEFRYVSHATLDLFHSKLQEKGWLQYARSTWP